MLYPITHWITYNKAQAVHCNIMVKITDHSALGVEHYNGPSLAGRNACQVLYEVRSPCSPQKLPVSFPTTLSFSLTPNIELGELLSSTCADHDKPFNISMHSIYLSARITLLNARLRLQRSTWAVSTAALRSSTLTQCLKLGHGHSQAG